MPAWKPLIVAFFALSALGLTTDSSDAKDKPGKPTKGAPGPVAGAGLPFLVVAGAYWLIRRRKRKTENPELNGSTRVS